MPGFVQIGPLSRYYGLASAFVLPSVKEAWGLVVNEAMAAGLPVMVSVTAGCRSDLVQDGANGFLFDPWDVNDIAGAMRRMEHLPEEARAAMGQRSRRIISAWSPKRFADGLLRAIWVARSGRHRDGSVGSEFLVRLLTHPLLCAGKR